MIKKSLIIVFVLTIAIILAASGCKQKPTNSTTKPKKKTSFHDMTKADSKQLLSDAEKDIDVMLAYKAGDDTATLDTAMAGPAAQLVKKTADQEAAMGKRKIRKYTNRKFKIEQYLKTVAGVSFTFTDEGYDVDKETNKQLSTPTNKKHRLILDLRRRGKRWVIVEIVSPELKKKLNSSGSKSKTD